MSALVLEVNDNGVSLSDENSVLAVSPGYALAVGNVVEFGDRAAARNRLHPLNCHNAFWHRLSMEPLTRPLAHFRHTADIAHAHLLDLAGQADAEGDVIVVVPGSYSRDQLSLLLGLLQHSPFNAVALTDAAVAAGVGRIADNEEAVYLDMGLHELLLTGLQGRGEHLSRKAVLPLPDLGWEALSNTLVQLVTDAFIRQCRFNPQHSAVWEQHLYNRLPEWLEQGRESGGTLLLEIRTESAVHEAQLTLDSVIRNLRPFYDRLIRELAALTGHGAGRVLVSRRCARLPGLMDLLEQEQDRILPLDRQPVGPERIARNCLELRKRLVHEDGRVHFLSVLPRETGAAAAEAGQQHSPAPNPEALPTHLLCGHSAHALQPEMVLGTDPRGELTAGSPRPEQSEEGAVLGKIERSDGQWVLRGQDTVLTVNGEEVSGEQALRPGDRIALPGGKTALQMIQVHNGGS